MRDDGGLIIDEPTIDTQQYPESNHRTTLVDHGTQFPAVVAIPPLRPRPSRRDERPGEDRSVPLQNRFAACAICRASRTRGHPRSVRKEPVLQTSERYLPSCALVRARPGRLGPRARESLGALPSALRRGM